MNDDEVLMFGYSRREAVEDGVLIDVSDAAKEAGIRFPVALTATVFADCVRVPEGVTGQDEKGRLWDLVWMLRVAVGRARTGESVIRFSVLVQNGDGGPKPVTLRAVCGPGDDPSPCITVMYPNED